MAASTDGDHAGEGVSGSLTVWVSQTGVYIVAW